jgi:hypothetical protein
VTPVVSLDVLPADVPAEYAPAMVSACSDALAEGRCAMAQTLPESTQPEAVALVLWQGEGFLQVTVRVGRGGGQWVARALSFSERDSISERWTTVGLTVATLVGETRAREAQAHSGQDETSAQPALTPIGESKTSGHPQTQSEAMPAATRPTAQPAALPPRWQGRIGLLTGPGWDNGDWRAGGWLSLGFKLPGTPVVLHGFGSYALSRGPTLQSEGLSTRWLTLGAGAGVTGIWQALNVAGTTAVEVAYRRVDVDVRGQTASDQEVPVSLRALVSYPADGTLAATGGALVRLPPSNPNESSGLQVRGPAVALELVAGLEVRL